MSADVPVEVGGVTLVVRVWPAEKSFGLPPVMLLPATAETAADWDIVAAALSSARTVYAVNLRGHGPSDWSGTYSIQLLADDVIGLLEGKLGRGRSIWSAILGWAGGLPGCCCASRDGGPARA